MSDASAVPPSVPAMAETFWSANGRARTVVVLLVLQFLLTAAALYNTIETEKFIARIAAGGQADVAEGDRLDMWTLIIAVPSIILQIGIIVIWLMWVFRAHLNLRLFTDAKLNFTSGWAVGWWFIPFANLVQPCRVMGEVWRRSDPRHDAEWRTGGAPLLLLAWWLAFLAEGVLGRISFRLSLRAEELPELLRAAHYEMVSEIASLVAIPLAIAVVTAINRAQQARLTGANA